MKKIVQAILLIQLSVAGLPAAAQESDTLREGASLAIPPLADLLDSAVRRSALLEYRRQEAVAKAANIDLEKNYWTRNLGFQADTRYGTFDNFSTTNSGLSTTIFNATSQQLNFGVGLYMKFPLSDLLNRKSQVKKATAEFEQARSMASAVETEIRQAVIRLYQEFLMRQRLMKIQSAALGNARVNLDMVEKEFKNGIIPVHEYARISDIVTRAEEAYEIAKKELALSRQLLEEVVGFSFSNPTKQP